MYGRSDVISDPHQTKYKPMLPLPDWLPNWLRELHGDTEFWTPGGITLTMNQDLINKFVELSEDDNPLHVDPVYARKWRFSDTIAHSALLYALTSKLLKPFLRRLFAEMTVLENRIGELEMCRAVECGTIISAEAKPVLLLCKDPKECEGHFAFRLHGEKGGKRELYAEGKRFLTFRRKVIRTQTQKATP